MTEKEILAKLNETVGDILDLDELALSKEMTAKDVEGWDSVATVQVMVAIEQAFGIRFRTGEMAAMQNIGDLVERITGHLEK